MFGSVRVAVIGSGPSGLYAADELSKHEAVSVDVVDRLPCPYGLLRYGVAPDHLKMKSLEITLRKILERPSVRFLGGVELGAVISVDELREYYDAVVYAIGSPVDRRLSIPGEDLPGSFSATEFVAWYCGHPDAQVDAFTLDAQSAVVIGVGNVAVDVARILAKTAQELSVTDMPDHVLKILDTSAVSDIHIIGRRSAAHAKFTTKELRELGELAHADVVVDPAELVLDQAGEELVATNKTVRRNIETLQEWSTRSQQGRARRIHLRFLLTPVTVLGTERVAAVQCARTAVDGSGGVTSTDERVTLEAQLLLRSVGYRGLPLPGVPFDEQSGVIPHVAGRVQRNGSTATGEYVVGWIKRGPTGVIGTNKGDAKETVEQLLHDLDTLPRAPHREPDAITDRLAQLGVGVVTWAGWEAIDAAEQALGAAAGRTRIKIADRVALHIAAEKANSRPS
ncbi:MAG: FAD-dependent oxidoreductase [Pseudonocardiaceae bacterium]